MSTYSVVIFTPKMRISLMAFRICPFQMILFPLKINYFLPYLQTRLFVFHVGSEEGKEFESENDIFVFLVTDMVKQCVEMNHCLKVHF